MKPLLFRLKIALLSLLISGAVLLAFGFFFLAGIQKVGMERVDREIRALGESQLRERHPREFWEGFDKSLGFIYGADASARLFVQVRDGRGEEFFSSDNCPAEVSKMKIPSMSFVQVAQPSPSQQTPPPGEEARRPPPRRDERGRPPPRSDEDFMTPPPKDERTLSTARLKETSFQTLELSSRSWRVGIMGNEFVTIFVGISLADFQAEANRFQKAFLVVTPLALLLLAAGGWLLATRALRPIAVITRTAEGISAQDLSRRVPSMNADAELARLVDVINGMLDRLQRSYNQAIRFSGDAAHELQTPLTVLQGELDNAVQAAVPGSEEQQRYSGLLEDVQRLKAITQKLLLLARADAGRLALNPTQVDLSALLASAVEDVEIMAPHLKIEQTIQPDVRVSADEALLGQVIRNMTTNAVKYNQDDGLIRFELKATDGTARFTLTNTGHPIPPEEREKIFDRFYRVDKSHSRKIDGSGLGLSLAREIARAHGGDVVLDPPGDGLISFTLTIPVGN